MEKNLNELINSFAEVLSEGNILAAEQLAKVSVAIAEERIERNMTQIEFAKFLGVSQGMVSKWESENYNFSIESLADICTKLDLDLDINIGHKRNCSIYHLKEPQWNNGNNVADVRIAGVA